MRYIICLTMVAALIGCGGTKELEKSRPPSSAANDLKKYENEFRPSDYDVDVKTFFSDLRRDNAGKKISSEPTVTESSNIVPGFRVQLLATTEIDDANAKKVEAESAFPGERFYIAYDPPAYKLRAGNYITRSDADAFAKFVQTNGYPDAWVVPERVIKNIQPRPTQRNQEQQQPKQ